MIQTERLILRQWCEADRAPYAAITADPKVMEHFPAPMSRDESDAAIDKAIGVLSRESCGNWAVERRKDGVLLGEASLKATGRHLPFDGGYEVGWRFARHAWGAGYASEAARACLAYGFTNLRLPRIVSFTATTNTRSQAVMERIGMTRRADLDFDHPALPPGHRLERHVVWEALAPR